MALRVRLGDDSFELVCDRGDIGRGGRACRLVRRLKGELGFLGAELVQAGLEPR